MLKTRPVKQESQTSHFSNLLKAQRSRFSSITTCLKHQIYKPVEVHTTKLKHRTPMSTNEKHKVCLFLPSYQRQKDTKNITLPGARKLTLAIGTRSGLMLYFSHPNIVPSLPNAHTTCTPKQSHQYTYVSRKHVTVQRKSFSNKMSRVKQYLISNQENIIFLQYGLDLQTKNDFSPSEVKPHRQSYNHFPSSNVVITSHLSCFPFTLHFFTLSQYVAGGGMTPPAPITGSPIKAAICREEPTSQANLLSVICSTLPDIKPGKLKP